MRTLLINRPRKLFLTKQSLEPHGLSPVRAGYDNALHFKAGSTDFREATAITMTFPDAPDLTRRLGADIEGSKRQQVSIAPEGHFTVRWSRGEPALSAYAGKQLRFVLDYQLGDERYPYAEGVLEIER